MTEFKFLGKLILKFLSPAGVHLNCIYSDTAVRSFAFLCMWLLMNHFMVCCCQIVIIHNAFTHFFHDTHVHLWGHKVRNGCWRTVRNKLHLVLITNFLMTLWRFGEGDAGFQTCLSAWAAPWPVCPSSVHFNQRDLLTVSEHQAARHSSC